MADRIALEATQARRALLADIAAGKVADDPDGAPHVHYGPNQKAGVAAAVWEMYRAGWCYQDEGSPWWYLTQRGLDVLAGKRVER